MLPEIGSAPGRRDSTNTNASAVATGGRVLETARTGPAEVARQPFDAGVGNVVGRGDAWRAIGAEPVCADRPKGCPIGDASPTRSRTVTRPRFRVQYDAIRRADPPVDWLVARVSVVSPVGTKAWSWRKYLGEWGLFVAFLAPNVAFLAVFTYWPLLYNVYLSLVDWDMVQPVKVFVGLANYRDLASDPRFWTIFFNTFYFVGVGVVATLLLAFGTALLLNQKLRGRNTARSVVFAPTILSGAAIAIVWIYVFDPRFGLIQLGLSLIGLSSPRWLTDPAWAMPAMIIVYVWKNFGYAVVVYLAGLQSIPRDLIEAATVDGAGSLDRLLNVVIPQLSPITFFLLVTTILGSFQAFDLVAVMTQGGPVDSTNTLIYHLYEEGFVAFHAGRAAAIAMVLFVLMLLVTVVQLRVVERRVHYS